jgi:hypothetical protein
VLTSTVRELSSGTAPGAGILTELTPALKEQGDVATPDPVAMKLPGFELTPAVLVGIGAGVASVLRLPLAAAVLGVLFGISAGPGAGPLILVGVIVAYLATLALWARFAPEGKEVIAPTEPPTAEPAGG